jgi:hypothetical protein
LPTAAAEHQAAQASLAAALAREVAAVWQALLNVAQLAKTLPDLSAVIAALVGQYGSASAAVAADYYGTARLNAGVSGLFTVVPASPPDHGQVDAGVRWATKGLWTPAPDPVPALKLTQAAVETLVLDTGRDTLIGAVETDRKARGFARHTEPGCCYFCAMLATRGDVYRSRQSASFQAHPGDRCQPEPVFTAYEPPAQVREWQQLWRSSTRGTSGKDAVAAFRQAFEGPARGEGTPHGG